MLGSLTNLYSQPEIKCCFPKNHSPPILLQLFHSKPDLSTHYPYSQVTAQPLLLLAQTPNSQLSTDHHSKDSDRWRLMGTSINQGERRQEMLELLMMVMEAKVRLQEEEKKN